MTVYGSEPEPEPHEFKKREIARMNVKKNVCVTFGDL